MATVLRMGAAVGRLSASLAAVVMSPVTTRMMGFGIAMVIRVLVVKVPTPIVIMINHRGVHDVRVPVHHHRPMNRDAEMYIQANLRIAGMGRCREPCQRAK
jgi:hypothetical protein